MPTHDRYDTIIVGAGIIGLAVARELLARSAGGTATRVLVVERESSAARHQTGHNSGVIHAGVYYAPGSLKARLCVDGAARMYDFCADREIDVNRIGKLIIALAESELPALEEIERRAKANGVAGLRRLDAAGLREIEPHATGVAALHSPNTGVVDFAIVAAALAADVRAAGGELRFDWEVTSVDPGARAIRLRSAAGDEVQGGRAVFCAGLWSDRLAVLAGADLDPRIVPFRGGYLRLAPHKRDLVRGLIYPVPDPSLPFLGVHLTPRIDGEVLLGPSALLVGARDGYALRTLRAADIADIVTWPGTWRMMARWWRTGVNELRMAGSRDAFAAEASRYVPGIRSEDLLPAFGGVRAQAVGRDGRLVDDFLLSATPRAIHVRNAPSPAATSSLALAGRIADAVDGL
ncbi:MAG TPA: L-2-hydroxyglutarate oxidase [Solirubrobacteraceae bacterium]|nr:L-2-hydroxyglutarate oxidase [Solirubrobacteraceae bacterium]